MKLNTIVVLAVSTLLTVSIAYPVAAQAEDSINLSLSDQSSSMSTIKQSDDNAKDDELPSDNDDLNAKDNTNSNNDDQTSPDTATGDDDY